ncbi:MAG: nuclear transport factor 2 family protein [Actinophytocola sp.]|uniref:nuclear transport factor 2 family protein n=1 Tax=Actinophytocola sp. TaxID=1872138 RepID=UPI003C707BCD
MVASTPSLPPSAAVTAIGVDHVRLLYAYLDAGELDGYASLVHEHASIRGLGPRDADSREDAVDMLRSWPPGTHVLSTIDPTDDGVTATGRYTGPAGTVDFVDVFTLSDCGLIHSHRRVIHG